MRDLIRGMHAVVEQCTRLYQHHQRLLAHMLNGRCRLSSIQLTQIAIQLWCVRSLANELEVCRYGGVFHGGAVQRTLGTRYGLVGERKLTARNNAHLLEFANGLSR